MNEQQLSPAIEKALADLCRAIIDEVKRQVNANSQVSAAEITPVPTGPTSLAHPITPPTPEVTIPKMTTTSDVAHMQPVDGAQAMEETAAPSEITVPGPAPEITPPTPMPAPNLAPTATSLELPTLPDLPADNHLDEPFVPTNVPPTEVGATELQLPNLPDIDGNGVTDLSGAGTSPDAQSPVVEEVALVEDTILSPTPEVNNGLVMPNMSNQPTLEQPDLGQNPVMDMPLSGDSQPVMPNLQPVVMPAPDASLPPEIVPGPGQMPVAGQPAINDAPAAGGDQQNLAKANGLLNKVLKHGWGGNK